MLPCAGHETFTLRNDLTELERLGQDLEAFGERSRLPSAVTFAINLALEEVITNAISYGYDDGLEHLIRVDLCVRDDIVVTTVEDDGRAFDPLAGPLPDVSAPLEHRQVGGLGVLLIRKLMDQVTYTRVDGKNVLVFTKAINSSAPPADHG